MALQVDFVGMITIKHVSGVSHNVSEFKPSILGTFDTHQDMRFRPSEFLYGLG